MKLLATRKSELNKTVLDPWTVVHFGVGLAAGLVEANFLYSLGAAVAYELFEQKFQDTPRGRKIFNTTGPEVWPNAVVDVIIFGVGYGLGHRWNKS